MIINLKLGALGPEWWLKGGLSLVQEFNHLLTDGEAKGLPLQLNTLRVGRGGAGPARGGPGGGRLGLETFAVGGSDPPPAGPSGLATPGGGPP